MLAVGSEEGGQSTSERQRGFEEEEEAGSVGVGVGVCCGRTGDGSFGVEQRSSPSPEAAQPAEQTLLPSPATSSGRGSLEQTAAGLVATTGSARSSATKEEHASSAAAEGKRKEEEGEEEGVEGGGSAG